MLDSISTRSVLIAVVCFPQADMALPLERLGNEQKARAVCDVVGLPQSDGLLQRHTARGELLPLVYCSSCVCSSCVLILILMHAGRNQSLHILLKMHPTCSPAKNNGRSFGLRAMLHAVAKATFF